MKSGDPKQVVLLSIVAVGAVGFCGYQIVGSKPVALQAVQQPEPTHTESSTVSSELYPTTLSGDPFSDPHLVVAAGIKSAPAPKDHKEGGEEPPTRPPSGQLFPMPMGALPGSTAEGGIPSQPEENTGATNKKNGASPAMKICLEGVVSTEGSFAMLTVNGKDFDTVRAGQVLEGIKILSIGSNFVDFAFKNQKFRLYTGEKVDL